jgi:AcrR family transcriptional regulator
MTAGEDATGMAKRAGQALHDEQEPSEPASLPSWKRQSVERSLQSARARAQDRSDRFVKAGLELIKTTGDTGFTVQEVVDESGMSIRTFYLFFASKDDLLLAIHETILSSEVAPRLRDRCDRVSDPVAKIRTFIEALFELSAMEEPATRAIVLQQHRLAESRPDDLDHAMEPQVQLFIELLEDAASAGQLRKGLDVTIAARLLHHMILSVTESRVLGSKLSEEITPDDVWDICSAALGTSSNGRNRS